MSLELHSRWQKKFFQTMGALKLLWGGGKERKYRNGKDEEDLQNWQILLYLK